MKQAWAVIKEAFVAWNDDKALRLSAALSYYTVFSLAPLLVIVIAIAGQIFGPDAVRGRIVEQFGSLVGPSAAEQIQTMIRAAYKPRSGWIAAGIGVIVLLIGAMGVFGQLKDALNTVWEATPSRRSGVWGFFRDRVLSLAMILGIAFLLLASLVVSTGLSALGGWIEALVPLPVWLVSVLDFVVSFAVLTVLFAMIYKILPDVKIAWRDVWLGAATTSVLFTIGKHLIGIYLGRSSMSSVYGAAGSLAVLLVWVYYSAAIFLLGAEFTEVFARRHGTLAETSRDAGQPPARRARQRYGRC